MILKLKFKKKNISVIVDSVHTERRCSSKMNSGNFTSKILGAMGVGVIVPVLSSLHNWLQLSVNTESHFGLLHSFRLRKGLMTLGVLDSVLSHPATWEKGFIHQDVKLTKEMVQDLFTVNFSPIGSNRRPAEEQCHAYWCDYLEELEGIYLICTVISLYVPYVNVLYVAGSSRSHMFSDCLSIPFS